MELPSDTKSSDDEIYGLVFEDQENSEEEDEEEDAHEEVYEKFLNNKISKSDLKKKYEKKRLEILEHRHNIIKNTPNISQKIKNILVKNNVYSEDKQNEIFHLVQQLKFGSKITDGTQIEDDYPPHVGVLAEITSSKEPLALIMLPELKTVIPENYTIKRLYVNLFTPREKPRFHTDSADITIVYYPNNSTSSYEPNNGGETQFYNHYNNTILGVAPVPNRIVRFDSKIIHSPKSFKGQCRYTIVTLLIHNDNIARHEKEILFKNT
jgi:hypothetical protein|tara:strand:- start:2872 stop:3669 length:798 start_codon:yes stop_codon:yes gene_type:complete